MQGRERRVAGGNNRRAYAPIVAKAIQAVSAIAGGSGDAWWSCIT